MKQSVPTPTASERDADAEDRRRRLDRRKQHVLMADWRYALRGRRRGARRSSADLVQGVDHYDRPILFLAMGVLLMSVLDATFTLRLIEAGVVEEWNPMMRALIERDVQLFANLKVALTAAAVLVLVACYHGRLLGRVPVSWVLKGTFAGYAALMGYHLLLLQLA